MPKKENDFTPCDNLTDSEGPISEQKEAEAHETYAAEKMVPESTLLAETDKYLRLAAEFDNYKKRTIRERKALLTDIRCDTILQILPVYDNLKRALNHDTEDAAYKKGVEMTVTQLEEALSNMGVMAIESVGKTFDPTLHDAVMHIEDERYGEKEIVEEFEKGFILGERVIRFSVVKVAN